MGDVPSHTHGRARAGRALAAAALAAVLAMALLGARSADPVPAQAAKAAACPALPSGLAPTGPSSSRFTMLIRINTQGNVNTWTQFNQANGGLAGFVRTQDIFVINTRFTGTGQFPAVTPDVAAQLSAGLRGTFPCNRIMDLTGLSFDPTQPGYAFTGVDDPNVSALLTDYEQADWNAGQATDPARPPWTDKFKLALPRAKGWNATLAGTVAANPAGASKRTGLAPQDDASWNYGQIAQDLDKKNSRLGARHIGPQSLQSQNDCADSAAAFGTRAKQLRMQYTFKFITKKIKTKTKKGKTKVRRVTMRVPLHRNAKPSLSNMAMEISFTDNPQASASQAILSTSAAEAAACVRPALKQGIGAFFFFAPEDPMRLLFQQPQIAPLRPWSGPGAAPSGGIGPH
jgi:hypothetical protein